MKKLLKKHHLLILHTFYLSSIGVLGYICIEQSDMLAMAYRDMDTIFIALLECMKGYQ